VRVNEEDHVRILAAQRGQDLQGAFDQVCQVHQAIEESSQRMGGGFAYHDRLGYVTACPSNLGTCLHVSATARIPFVSAQTEFSKLCERLEVVARPVQSSAKLVGVMEISNKLRLGSSEVDQVNSVIVACRVLVELEAQLEGGEEVIWDDAIETFSPRKGDASMNTVACRSLFAGIETSGEVSKPLGEQVSTMVEPELPQKFSSIPGLGDEEYPGFPADVCPDIQPDLSKNFTLMAEVLKNDDSIYDELKRVTTENGVSLAKCIKTGIDNPGHPMIKTVGAVAGDAECYEIFKGFFDPLIKVSHRGGKFAEVGHTTDLDYTKVSNVSIDAEGTHVVMVRIRAQRNLAGLRMLPACSRDERREVERVCCKAFHELSGEYAGKYFPLRGSSSYLPGLSGGMTEQEENDLEAEGLLFCEPDAALVLSTGTGRHWPEARGIFHVPNCRLGLKLTAWINEEDHLRLISTDSGCDVRAAFQSFCMMEASLQEKIQQAGYDFAWNSKLGYLTACPSNLGSGIRAEVSCRLPFLTKQPGFKDFCRRWRLQVRGSANHDPGVWEVVNLDQLGPSEVEQINAVIEGTRKFVELEKRLEEGKSVDLSDDQGT
jgi:creatine kinase